MELQEREWRGEVYLRCYTKEGLPDGPLQYVIRSYRGCLPMWKESWKVVSIDGTYKTNRINMPLAQVTGVTGVNITLNISCDLLVDEKGDSYRWLLQQLRIIATSVLGMNPVRLPS